jgi:predicted ATPase
MNYKVILIVGLPGSGKTTLATSMLNSDTFLIDDPSRDTSLFTKALESGKSTIIICDPLLIVTKAENVITFMQKKFGSDVDIQWIYFDNDPVQTWKNHEQRNKHDYRLLDKNKFNDMSKKYAIPENVTPISVYKGR